MAQVPLPTGFKSLDEYPRLRERLINMMNIGGNKLLSRQGIEAFSSGVDSCRGQHKFQNELYQISGNKLIKIAADGSVTNISDDQLLDIEGTEETQIAVGFTFMVIIVKSAVGRGYAWDGTTLVEISNPNFVACRDVTYMNGRWIYIPFDGQPAFFSEALDPTNISGTNFFDAESQPDLNSGTVNLRNRLYILGEETTEVFRDTGTGTVPYQKIDGASIWTGYVAGRTFWSSTFAFLGKDKDNNFGFFIMGSGDAPRISNPALDQVLNEEYTPQELTQCIGQRWQFNGQDIAVFRLPRNTWGYNNGEWFELNSITTFEEQELLNEDFKTWRAKYITHCYGEYFVGDVQTNDIGMLTDIETDYGEDIERGFDTFLRSERGSYFTAKNLELDGIAGQTSPAQTIGLSVSDDGKTYGDFFFVEMGEIGAYLERVFWEFPGGLGTYESFMGIRIRTTAPVEIATEGLSIDT